MLLALTPFRTVGRPSPDPVLVHAPRALLQAKLRTRDLELVPTLGHRQRGSALSLCIDAYEPASLGSAPTTNPARASEVDEREVISPEYQYGITRSLFALCVPSADDIRGTVAARHQKRLQQDRHDQDTDGLSQIDSHCAHLLSAAV
jgi:hypothetical protein